MNHVATRLLALLPILIFLVTSPARGQQGDAPIVEVKPIEYRVIRVSQTLVGTVIPLRKAVVGSAVDGRVIEFPIREGDRVEEGQTLAVLLTATIRLERDAAQGELELRMAELDELVNGSLVEEVSQARARMGAAKAAMEYQKARRERTEALYRQGRVATEDELQEAIASALRTHEEHDEAVAAYELTVQGPRKERIAQARARVAMYQAMVDRLDEQIQRHTIVSRFPGYISHQHTEEGAWVNRGDDIAEVVDLDEVEIEVNVPEERISQVQLRDTRVTVDIPSIPDFDYSGRSQPRIEAIVPQANTKSRTFRVKIRVKNEIHEETQQPLIKAGMLASVTLAVGEEEGLVVLKDALVLGGSEPLILVVDPSSIETYEDSRTGRNMARGVVQRIPVKTGVEDGTSIAVTSQAGTLTDGMLVVTMGNERISPPAPGRPAVVRWLVSEPITAQVAR